MSREDERRQAELDKMAADKEAIALADKYESLDESDRPADFVRLIGVLRNPGQAYAVGGRTGYNQLPMSTSEEAKKYPIDKGKHGTACSTWAKFP